MTHDELLAKIDNLTYMLMENEVPSEYKALRAVVKLHKCSNLRFDLLCDCGQPYPCATIKVIEKELQ